MLPIIVPYTQLYRETVEALPQATFVEITSDDGYRLLLRELWAKREPFILVEHDVAPTAEQIARLNVCDQPWCHYGYVAGDWVPKLGCVRFSRELIEGTAGVWDDTTWVWGQLDARFADVATALGFRSHWHSPHVLHLRNSYFGPDGRERRIHYDRQTDMQFIKAEAETLRTLL